MCIGTAWTPESIVVGPFDRGPGTALPRMLDILTEPREGF